MKITIRIYQGKKVVKRMIGTRENWRRLYAKLASARHQTRYFIRVEYGYDKDVFGERVMFDNKYDGDNQKEAKEALRAFLEK